MDITFANELMKTSKPSSKVSKPTLKQVYEKEKETDPLILSKLADVKYETAKRFLKSINSQADLTKEHRKTKTVRYAPAGADSMFHFQSDIMFLKDYKKSNNGHIGVLTLLNTTTRKADARAVKSTQAQEVSKKMEEMLDKLGSTGIDVLRVDEGVEFNNSLFKKILDERGIILEMQEANTHAWLNRTNRFHRTLKNLIRDNMLEHKTSKWTSSLASIIARYKKTPTKAFKGVFLIPAKGRGMTNRELAPNDIVYGHISEIN